MKIEEKFVETSYGRVYYLEAGTGDKTLIFLHGFFGDPRGIRYLTTLFANSELRIIALYLPGHGKSFGLPDNFSFGQYVQAVREAIGKICAGQYLVLGSSFGGRIGWELVNSEPNCVGAILHAPPLLKLDSTTRLICTLIADWCGDEFAGLYMRMREKDWLPDQASSPRISRFRFSQLPRLISLFASMGTAQRNPIKKKIVLLWGRSDKAVPCPKDMPVEQFPGGHFWFLRNYPKFHEQIKNFVLKEI
jgi:pimeloyl-ACP methyl ester carboxylesterase